MVGYRSLARWLYVGAQPGFGMMFRTIEKRLVFEYYCARLV